MIAGTGALVIGHESFDFNTFDQRFEKIEAPLQQLANVCMTGLHKMLIASNCELIGLSNSSNVKRPCMMSKFRPKIH